jgi:hypothetical protein
MSTFRNAGFGLVQRQALAVWGILGSLCITGLLDNSVELQLHDIPLTPIFHLSSHMNNETADSMSLFLLVNNWINTSMKTLTIWAPVVFSALDLSIAMKACNSTNKNCPYTNQISAAVPYIEPSSRVNTGQINQSNSCASNTQQSTWKCYNWTWITSFLP